ncbi:hypothetical protein [Bathymodiolus japonicus methanotrophic gill symbiont]|uniref:hypothetical protein n=1 Tax=Bathymodiolus japonicus methanotrophic gill symbiont TaxID=113269 RepID=UPI001C8D8F41|nr:hypothetical protein [Bathymodiolus japonicus methanotrophic gill symbiont]
MGDALNALRPQRLRTKAASSLLPHWLDGYSECNSCSSRVLLAHVRCQPWRAKARAGSPQKA